MAEFWNLQGQPEPITRWRARYEHLAFVARWYATAGALDGTEAILKLPILLSNGDFDQYWRYHLRKEHKRVHNSPL